MAVESTVRGRGVAAAIARVIHVNRDPAPAFKRGGRKLVGRVQMGFRRGVDPYGYAWKPPRRGGQPLVKSGRLRRSFRYRVEGSGLGAVLRIGTNVRYAPTHQYGAAKGEFGTTDGAYTSIGGSISPRKIPIPWGDIPARPMLPDSVRRLPPAWARDLITELNREAGLVGA